MRKQARQLYVRIAKEMHAIHNMRPSSEWRKHVNAGAMLAYEHVYEELQRILFPDHEGKIRVNTETGEIELLAKGGFAEYHRQHLKNQNGSRVDDCPTCQEIYGPDAI